MTTRSLKRFSRHKKIPENHGEIFLVSSPNCTEEEMTQAIIEHDLLVECKTEQNHIKAANLDISMLTTALRNVGQLSTVPIDETLYQDMKSSLEPQHRFDWRSIWMIACHTYLVTLTAKWSHY